MTARDALREEVARAICDAEWNETQPWERKPETFRLRYRRAADAVLSLPAIAGALGVHGTSQETHAEDVSKNRKVVSDHPEEAEARVRAAVADTPDWAGDHPSCATAADLRALLSMLDEARVEVNRLRDVLLGIAESDHYRRYPKQHEDGGLRGQSGLRAVRALTGQHGSYLNDDEVRRLDQVARATMGDRQ